MKKEQVVIERSIRSKIVELFPDNRARQEFAFRFIETIYQLAEEQEVQIVDFVKTPSYRFDTGSRHFKPVRGTLIAARVLWQDPSYLAGAKRYKRLAIDEQYIKGDLVVEEVADTRHANRKKADERGRLASNQRKVMKGLALSVPDVSALKREDLLDPTKMPQRLTEYPAKIHYYDHKTGDDHWLSGKWAKENNGKRHQLFSMEGKIYSRPASGYDRWAERWAATKETYVRQQLLNIQNGRFYCRRNSDSTHRLYSTITGLPRTARQYLLLDGEPLVEIDMKNAQFALLAWAIDKLDPKAGKIHFPVHFREASDSIMGALDYQIFRKVVNDGRLYEYIMEALGIPEREKAKALVFPFFFNNPDVVSKHFHRLDQIFPSVWALRCKWHEMEEVTPSDPEAEATSHEGKDKVEKITTGGTHNPSQKKKNKAPKGKHFSCLLQKLEAYLMLDKVYVELVRHGYRTLTLHDCVLTKQSDAQAVLAICQETLKSNGFEGRICIKEEKGLDRLAS